jgi:predicted HTH domain antitoxin
MEITVEMPDDIAKHLGETAKMPRRMLEAFAAEAYRTQKLSRHQISQLLGLDYWQTEDFLTQREAKRPYTLADLAIDRQSLAGLPKK